MTKSIADELIDAIGANDEHQAPRNWLDTGIPSLNDAISGDHTRGLPSGRMIEIFGLPSCGKTLIATSAMIAAQRAGGIACFMDHERSFDVRLAEALGLDVSPGKWIFKTPETFEQSVGVTMKLAQRIREKKLLPINAPICVVYDSLAFMVPAAKFTKIEKEEAFNMNDNTALARATAQVMPGLMQWCEKYEMTAIFLNQSRTKVGVVYGDPTTTPGGSTPEFAASVRIKLSKAKLTKGDGEAKEAIGSRITAEVVKNKVARPFKKATWDFLFKEDGSGYIDVVGSVVDHLLDKGKLEKAGAYIVWEGGKFHRAPLINKLTAENALPKLLDLLPKAA